MNNYDNMTQKQLRPACKAAGIKYGKMNVKQMRTALRAVELQGLPKTDPAIRSKQKTKKVTVVQNGVRQPGEGTKCRGVWDALDSLANQLDSVGDVPSVGHARVLAGKNDWNVNNTVIEFYQWRKFNGLTGRVKIN